LERRRLTTDIISLDLFTSSVERAMALWELRIASLATVLDRFARASSECGIRPGLSLVTP
jgi:hypothetical protein